VKKFLTIYFIGINENEYSIRFINDNSRITNRFLSFTRLIIKTSSYVVSFRLFLFMIIQVCRQLERTKKKRMEKFNSSDKFRRERDTHTHKEKKGNKSEPKKQVVLFVCLLSVPFARVHLSRTNKTKSAEETYEQSRVICRA
jgi:UDP-N-acetylmuramyl pentapeptide phosphotransferase/UDP-N-acetylglucosamine-1-phosphate transferase